MQLSDRPSFSDLIRNALAFYKQDATTFALQVWWQACQGFEIEQLEKAITAHVMDPERGQFAPKPADIVRQLQGTQTDRAALAWGKVYEAMREAGSYRDVCFDDPIIHLCIQDLGGWPQVCKTEIDDLSYLQHRFGELYKANANQKTRVLPKYLAGICGTGENVAKYLTVGLEAPEPAFIGLKKAPMQIDG